MVIHELSATGFRNFSDLKISFSDRINTVFGLNGQGKTNLVEAVHFLSHLDSFRTHRLSALIGRGHSSAHLKGIVETRNTRNSVRIEISRNGRRAVLDNQPVSTLSSYISNYFSLVFNPDYLYRFRHVPAERRWLLNRYLSFVDPAYLKALREFRVVHAQKNRLLRNGELSSLPAWNHLFAERSYAILMNRMELEKRVNPALRTVYSLLTGRREALRLQVHPSLSGSVEEMSAALAHARDSESRAGHALAGPHRDDVQLELDGAGNSEGMSQGEYRAAVLALQLALARLMEAERGFRPVLVLDDVFSELDASVRERLLQHLQGLPNQMFITTTEWSESVHVPGARVMEIRAGRVTAVKE